MLSKETFKKGFQKLCYLYIKWPIKMDDSEIVRNWYENFKDMRDEDFIDMVDNYIKNETFHPTVAGLLKYRAETKEKLSEKEIIEIRQKLDELVEEG